MNIVNQAFRIKIAYRSEKEKEKKKKEKMPGIGRYPMGPTIIFFPGKFNSKIDSKI